MQLAGFRSRVLGGAPKSRFEAEDTPYRLAWRLLDAATHERTLGSTKLLLIGDTVIQTSARLEYIDAEALSSVSGDVLLFAAALQLGQGELGALHLQELLMHVQHTCSSALMVATFCTQMVWVDAASYPCHAGLWGGMRTARLETSSRPYICVDVNRAASVDFVDTLHPHAGASHESEFALCSSHVRVARLDPATRTARPQSHESGTTGGMHVAVADSSAMGLLVRHWLRRVAPSMLICQVGVVEAPGRGSYPPLSCMVTWKGTKHLMANLQPGRVPLQGVWHCRCDAFHSSVRAAVQKLSTPQKPYAARVECVHECHAASLLHPLRAFASCSSTHALIGVSAFDEGHDSSSSCIDALAGCRKARGTLASHLRWSHVNVEKRLEEISRSVAPLTSATAVLHVLLNPSILATTAIIPRGGAALGVGAQLRFQALLDRPMLEETAPAGRSRARPSAPDIKAPDTPSKPLFGLVEVLDLLEQAIGVSADADVPLMEAGLDSMTAVELRNGLQEAANLSLPSTIAFDHPTARQISMHLAQVQPAPAPRKAQAASGADYGSLTLADVSGIVEQVIGASADADVPLMEAGLDSMTAVELRNTLQSVSGAALPSVVAFDHPTTRLLAAFLIGNVPGQEACASSAPVGPLPSHESRAIP
jgi:acyl carrier protein